MRFEGTQSYIAAEDLEVAVTLHRPLLVKGAPGTGKTVRSPTISASANWRRSPHLPVLLFERLAFLARRQEK